MGGVVVSCITCGGGREQVEISCALQKEICAELGGIHTIVPCLSNEKEREEPV